MRLALSLALVALVACGSGARPTASREAAKEPGADRKSTPRLDEQRPLRLVYCVESGGMSTSDAADVIRERVARRDDVIVKTEEDRLVFELPADRDAGPMDREQAAAELTAVLRSGDLPRPVPCD
jgi:hypothetical protein